ELVRQRTVESENFKRREVVGTARMVDTSRSRLGFAGATYGGDGSSRDVALTVAHTDEAAAWQGWGTALKPAFEPIVLARKPLAEKTVARNVLAHGTGAINVDACRVEAGDLEELQKNWDRTQSANQGIASTGLAQIDLSDRKPAGRWPANVLLDQHAAAWVDEQSGDRPGFATQRHLSPGKPGMFGVGGGSDIGPVSVGFNDSGGASRFFKVAESDESGALSPYFPREFDDAFLYAAKAPKSERPNVGGVQHPTVKPLAIMRWLIRLVTPPGGVVLDPFAGSGTTIEAAL